MKKQKALTTATSLATLMAIPEVGAEIAYFSGINGFIADNSDPFQPWDIDGDTIPEAQTTAFTSTFGPTTVLDLVGTNYSFQFALTSGGGLQGLSNGATIDGSLLFASAALSVVSSGGPLLVSGLSDGVPGFIGFSFNPTGSTTLFGWARIALSSTADPFGQIEVFEWAYEDSGAAIQAGAIPEPDAAPLGLGLLALGAAGLRRWRGSRR
ncbi:MAG: hypothetical protein AAF546_09205 [Verrucomicrobiota bacterium]